MIIRKELSIEGKHSKNILLDFRYQESNTKKPVIIFCHGFKGFKDFACFNLLADFFAMNGYLFLKFNFSHNGTTPEFPTDFVDLDAFSKNTFSIELDDLETVIDVILHSKNEHFRDLIDDSDVSLIGHSRGGGIAILKAFEDTRIKKLITWASVNQFGYFWDEQVMTQWKLDGIRYEMNGRTKQKMPMLYNIYEDLEKNKTRLDIPFAIKNLRKPFLAIHGDKDETVRVEKAIQMKEWNEAVTIKIIEGANHTFDGKHPWEDLELPQNSMELAEQSLFFIKSP